PTQPRSTRFPYTPLFRSAAVQAALEPAHPLRRRAVREGVRHHVALALLLQRVVADGGGRVQAFLDVAGLEDIARLVGLARPQARSEEHTSELQSRENLVC